MPKPTLIPLVLFSSLMVTATNAQGIKSVCAGVLTDMRVIGITLGDCDLNSMTANDLKRITDACGEPANINGAKEMHCRISAIVSPHKSIPSENHRYGAPVYVAQQLLEVSRQ
jgi:hypothetical protein